MAAGGSRRSGWTTEEIEQSSHVELGRELIKFCRGRREDAAKPAAAAQLFESGAPPVGRAT